MKFRLSIFLLVLSFAGSIRAQGPEAPSGGRITVPVPRQMRSRARPELKATAILITKNEDGQWYYAPDYTVRLNNITRILASFVPADVEAERMKFAEMYWKTQRELADEYLAYIASLYFVELLCRSGQYRFKSTVVDVQREGPIAVRDVASDWQEWKTVVGTPWATVRARVCRG